MVSIVILDKLDLVVLKEVIIKSLLDKIFDRFFELIECFNGVTLALMELTILC